MDLPDDPSIADATERYIPLYDEILTWIRQVQECTLGTKTGSCLEDAPAE